MVPDALPEASAVPKEDIRHSKHISSFSAPTAITAPTPVHPKCEAQVEATAATGTSETEQGASIDDEAGDETRDETDDDMDTDDTTECKCAMSLRW